MRAAILILLPLAAQAFFFGNQCGCQQRCPVPSCPLPVAPVCPPPPVCGGGPVYQAQPQYVSAPQYAPVQQIQQAQPQQQYYQQLPVTGYAVNHQAAQPIAQFAAEEQQLAAQSDNHEIATAGQSATLAEEEAAPEAPAAHEAAAATTDDLEVTDVNDAAPQPAAAAAPAGESATAAQNTVYDDIVNAAQGATPTEEYHAAAASRRRYHSIRRAPAAANFDPKCNSETLKNIIHQNIGDSTSSSKRSIQKAASEEVGGHVDVICSTGTFSYIVNTELYCETEKDGITCFAFRQSN